MIVVRVAVVPSAVAALNALIPVAAIEFTAQITSFLSATTTVARIGVHIVSLVTVVVSVADSEVVSVAEVVIVVAVGWASVVRVTLSKAVVAGRLYVDSVVPVALYVYWRVVSVDVVFRTDLRV